MKQTTQMTEKIQKLLANAGVASRREVERLIEQGLVTVDGTRAHVGQRLTGNESIKVNNKTINILKHTVNKQVRVLIYHKPLGEICTRSDPQGRKSVYAMLPPIDTGRWIMIGRLDINSEGLLLFTNDGELAHRLMHPATQLEREYLVRVHGQASDEDLHDLLQGVMLDDGNAHFSSITPKPSHGSNQWYSVVIKEGRNRLVRRLWAAKKKQVNRLIRIRFCAIMLPRSLKPGRFKELATKDVKVLLKVAGCI